MGGGNGEKEVEVAGQGGEGGLDGIQEDGVGEARVRGAVGCGCYAFLEEGPGETSRGLIGSSIGRMIRKMSIQ